MQSLVIEGRERESLEVLAILVDRQLGAMVEDPSYSTPRYSSAPPLDPFDDRGQGRGSFLHTNRFTFGSALSDHLSQLTTLPVKTSVGRPTIEVASEKTPRAKAKRIIPSRAERR
eukprot:CAMPEP_0174732710 /NCGR_PEP_ID=MMETSP1094-20130205/59899_1 /TAXON_ID=156173 /ORGANISM="Chrysochromulina brevifilum, Strain UTEX LB 985" /LENGTH=114 /DNA_ID=CAMNT_0015935259 /DNA_START=387 /DNA_END=728 /DNA_ORIENTATION=-